MYLTKEQEELLKKYGEFFLKNPLCAIEEGLMYSYDGIIGTDLVEFSHVILRQVVEKIIQQRGIDISEDAEFDIDEMVNKEDEIDSSIIEDFDSFQGKIMEKIHNSSSDELDDYLTEISIFYKLMHAELLSNHISKAINKLHTLFSEANMTLERKKEEKEEVFVSVFDDESNFDVWDDGVTSDEKTNSQEDTKKSDQFSDEEICNILKMLNSYPKIMDLRSKLTKIIRLLEDAYKDKLLDEFKSDEKFYKDVIRIMSHDKKESRYYYHGTQDVESAKSIIELGLGMTRDDILSTAVSEFTVDELLLYHRGLAGEIGRNAVVIIDSRIGEDGSEENLVEENEDISIPFAPSGLQGLEGKPKYIVNSRHIVGYVDKKNKIVIFNPRYHNYAKFNQEQTEDMVISLSSIENATNSKEKE